jgi:hypothetical protein
MQIVHNELYNAAILNKDIGIFYTNGTDGNATEVAYNVVHDELEPGIRGFGIYLDNNTWNFNTHHNVIWLGRESGSVMRTALAANLPGGAIQVTNSPKPFSWTPPDMTGVSYTSGPRIFANITYKKGYFKVSDLTDADFPGGRFAFGANLSNPLPPVPAPTPTNTPPTASLSSSATTIAAPATVTLTATASDSNGTISKVDFFQGANLLGTDTTSPYTFTKSSLAAGAYAFSAKATDNAGAVGTSNTVNVTVTGSTTTPLPDVIVTALSYASGTFTCTVKNQGNAATPSGAQIGVEYSVDGVRRTWGLFAGPLAAGASVTIGTGGGAYVIPDGSHTILAWVDDLNRFAESNESNNKFSQVVTVGAPPLPTAGPVAMWKLDETSGTTAADSSGNALKGTLGNYSASGWTAGKIGGALNFNGVSNIVTVGSPAALTNLARYTVAAWIKPRSLGELKLGRIVNKRSAAGWALFLNTDGSAFFRQTFSTTEGAWSTPANSVALGAWLHVAVAYDSSSSANRPVFYINGKLVTTTVRAAPAGSRSSDAASLLTIGNTSTLERTFDGAIDDVRIYNRILTATEIGTLVTAMPTGTG